MTNEIIDKYAQDPNSVENILEMAKLYFTNNNYAAAYSLYMRVLDVTNVEGNEDLHYDCLLLAANVLNIVGNRWKSVCQNADFAISINPNRPEAYLIKARAWQNKLYTEKVYSAWGWINVYTNAKLALQFANNAMSIIWSDIYEVYTLLTDGMLKLGKLYELRKFLLTHDLSEHTLAYVQAIFCYNELGEQCPYTAYINFKHDRFLYKFNGLEQIIKNYSETMQDIFVLSVLNGKRNGTYVEIGSADPIYKNNTYLLEKYFGWKGLSIDTNSSLVNKFNETRTNKCICTDAITYNYYGNLETVITPDKDGFYDYLQLDIDPAENTLKCLLNIPFNKYKFRTITFEHDAYRSGDEVRDKSRAFLENLGYIRIISNVNCSLNTPYEDWYVHKSVLDDENNIFAKKILESEHSTKGNVDEIFFE